MDVVNVGGGVDVGADRGGGRSVAGTFSIWRFRLQAAELLSPRV